MAAYETHRLSHSIRVHELISADYLTGLHAQTNIHVHQNAYEMCVCMKGKMYVHKNGTVMPLEAGKLTFIHPQTPHEIISDDRKGEVFIIAFTWEGYDLRPIQNSVVSVTKEISDLISKLMQELSDAFALDWDVLRFTKFQPNPNAPLGSEQMICSYLEQILILVLRKITMNNNELVPTSQIKTIMQNYLIDQVVSYIKAHLSEELSIGSIAEHFHYSRTYLATLFKQTTGITIGEYITLSRIVKAKTLLLEKEKSISQIARETGFSSLQYFSHRFAKEVGCSPTQFAQMHNR